MKKKFSDRTSAILGSKPIQLKKISANSEEYFQKAQKNCENMIGTVSVPIGIAGPLLIRGEYADGEFVIPLATTEGALVASINRGCKAITQSGGAMVTVKKIGMTRAPVFRMKSAEHGKKAKQWFRENFEVLQKETRKNSNHLELLKVKTATKGGFFFAKFWFDPQDAMGMNMVTIACDHLIRQIITPKTKLECVALSGNWCADKKPSVMHLLEGRGFEGKIHATISRNVVHDVLKTTPEKLKEVYTAKILIGSQLVGFSANNAHIANIIAALYLATGQDIAHVVEGSHGVTVIDITDQGDLFCYVHLPAIVCGVIGGGTHLPKQQEALNLLGVKVDTKHPGRANQMFAEIIGAAVLAGELSLLAALSSGDLAKAHEEARKRRINSKLSP